MTRRLMIGVVLLFLMMSIAACEPLDPLGIRRAVEQRDVIEVTAVAEQPTAAPTAPVLTTPTPLPPPPSPTPVPPTETPRPVPASPVPATSTAGALEMAETSSQEPTDTPQPPTPTPTQDPKSVVTNVMMEVPAGPFTMGSDQGDAEDKPAHEIDLPAFEIDRFEVTNSDYARFTEATGYLTYAEQKGFRSWRDEWGAGEDNHAVVTVTWDDALSYCEWLRKRLATEAEWEKAARGTDARRFPWGSDWDPSKANVKERGLRGTAAVGSFPNGASAYGVDDMAGNVWEWTADWYKAYPGNTAADSYYGEKFRVTRGGGWFDSEEQVTAYSRNAADPAITANDDLGFRCAR